MARTGVHVFAGMLIAGHPMLASAGGFEFPDLGTVPIGRGAAFVARADTLDAFHYNPAGLAKHGGPGFLIGSNVVHLDNRFRRGGGDQYVLLPWNRADPASGIGDVEVFDPVIDVNTGEPYREVRNGARFGPAPLLVASWGDVGVDGLSLSLGFVPGSSFGSHEWPQQGPQRYTIRSGRFAFFSVGAGLAYRANRYFSIGANFLSGVFLSEFSFATRQTVVPMDPQRNEDFAGDNVIEIRARDSFVPSANFGMLSEPLDWIELGISVRLPFFVRAEGELEYSGGEESPDSRLATASLVRLQQHFPVVVRSGVRWIHRWFDLELDFVWENWASLRRIDIRFSNPDADFEPESDPMYNDPSLLYLDSQGNGLIYSPMIPTPVPLRFRDTYSVRLGSDVALWPGHVTVRAGSFYASPAYPRNNATYSIRFPYTHQVGAGFGLTWHALPNMLDVSAGYLHIWQPNVKVADRSGGMDYDGGIAQAPGYRRPLCDSDGRACVPGRHVLGNIVNNGVYRARLDIFGAAVEGHF